jgi:hypothetical protein
MRTQSDFCPKEQDMEFTLSLTQHIESTNGKVTTLQTHPFMRRSPHEKERADHDRRRAVPSEGLSGDKPQWLQQRQRRREASTRAMRVNLLHREPSM